MCFPGQMLVTMYHLNCFSLWVLVPSSFSLTVPTQSPGKVLLNLGSPFMSLHRDRLISILVLSCQSNKDIRMLRAENIKIFLSKCPFHTD